MAEFFDCKILLVFYAAILVALLAFIKGSDDE